MDYSDIPHVGVSELPAEPGDTAVVLDVREDDEWRLGHVRGAQHIPLGDVPARMHEIDPDKELLVICHSGGRSERVAVYLQRNGLDATVVDGGMLAWVAAGRQVVVEDGGVPA